MRSPSLPVFALACGLSGCASDPAPYEKARAGGYAESEQLHDVVRSVRPTDDGDWAVGIGDYSRNFYISNEYSPDAAALVEEARALEESQQKTHVTILVHETAPRAKTPEEYRRPARKPRPWILVRFGTEPDPNLKH